MSVESSIVVHAEAVDGVAQPKPEIVWECSACDGIYVRDACRCPSCGTFNSLREQDRKAVRLRRKVFVPTPFARPGDTDDGGESVDDGDLNRVAFPSEARVFGAGEKRLVRLADMTVAKTGRMETGEPSFDDVLGGGLVIPSVVLIGGAPGIGKSRLLTQVFGTLGNSFPCLYGAGEESQSSVALRATDLKVLTAANRENLTILQTTDLDEFFRACLTLKVKMAVLDSIQTFTDPAWPDAPPGRSRQVTSIAGKVEKFAHKHEIAMFVVCHITKGGDFAGPMEIMHHVDACVMFDHFEHNGNDGLRRVVASPTKNRFGSTEICGVFAMREDGLKSVEM